MDDKDDPDSPIIPKLSVLLAGVASAAAVVTVYHCIVVCYRNRRRQRSDRQQLMMYQTGDETRSSVDRRSAALLMIPAYEYRKGMKVVGTNDEVCAVCLSEFEEGEELRTLPECMHSFHVPCIDMWLYSHTNCPLCRSIATPSPLLHHAPAPESSSAALL